MRVRAFSCAGGGRLSQAGNKAAQLNLVELTSTVQLPGGLLQATSLCSLSGCLDTVLPRMAAWP